VLEYQRTTNGKGSLLDTEATSSCVEFFFVWSRFVLGHQQADQRVRYLEALMSVIQTPALAKSGGPGGIELIWIFGFIYKEFADDPLTV
jgi:hypothetical protein